MSAQDFLFELGCEELPAAELAPLAHYLANFVEKKLVEARLGYKAIQTFYTPRRLALYIQELQTQTQAQILERRGPAKITAFTPEGQPTRALDGFLKSCNAVLADLIEIETDKGIWLALKINQPATAAKQILPSILEQTIKTMPIKKAMRWGNHDFSFLRPVYWIVALQGETIIPLRLFGLEAGRLTYGHRFHHPQAIALKQASDYREALRQAFVMVDPDERRHIIEIKSQTICPKGLKVHFGKLAEVVNLVEWPVPLLCTFAPEFLVVPQAVLISTMEANQRVFPVLDHTGAIQNYFITVANIESHHPAEVIAGNERVVRARLADARFFYEEDLKIPLEQHFSALQKITFQQGLGTLADKTVRLETLVEFLAQQADLNKDASNVKKAAHLCKCDLVTQMVQEFPELQGYMGHQYALKQGEPAEVALAIEEHYLPKGRGGALPQSQLGILLALADKIDTLVGLIAIGKTPTSGGDPFALRRQALGVIAILVENKIHLNLREAFAQAEYLYQAQGHRLILTEAVRAYLGVFFEERMEIWLRDEKSLPITVIHAVLNRQVEDQAHLDPYAVYECIDALNALLKCEEGQILKELAKRIGNILKDKKGQENHALDTSLFGVEEQVLYALLNQAETEYWCQLPVREQYLQYLQFSQPIADFFDKVLVNADDAVLRQNRLQLLQNVYGQFMQLADFSKLS